MKIAIGADHAGFEAKEKIKQQLEYVLRSLRGRRRTGHFNPTATTPHIHTEPLLDVTKVLVHGANEVGEACVVDRLEREIASFYGSTQEKISTGDTGNMGAERRNGTAISSTDMRRYSPVKPSPDFCVALPRAPREPRGDPASQPGDRARNSSVPR